MIFPFIVILNYYYYLCIWLHLLLVTAHRIFRLLLLHAESLAAACGICFLTGIEPGPPTLVSQSLNHWTPESSPVYYF